MLVKMLYYYVILFFLIISPYAFSASLCENAFSKALSFIRGEAKNTPQFLPPSTSILVELRQKSTQIYSSFSTYHTIKLEYGDSRFLQREYIYEDFFEEANHAMTNVGDSYYWSRYIPRRIKKGEEHLFSYNSGQFIIGFAIRLVSSHLDRSGYFYHRIHWDSDARNEKLNRETIRKIFTGIYQKFPEIIATEFQSEFIKGGNVSSKEVDRLIVPFLNEGEKAGQIKQIVLKVLQRRGNRF